MVKALFLGLLAATMCGFARAAPAPQPDQPSRREESPSPTPPPQTPQPPQAPLEDPAARSERSTNLSHVTGINRKIQMVVKNRILQILPDGTVNGTTDRYSRYSFFQKTAVDVGRLKIQGVVTCQYLCMNSCGLLYGSMKFVNECIFNENIEPHNYNTYTSTLYSDGRRNLYLALNGRGQPRRVLLRAHQSQGNVTTYIRVMARTVPPKQLEDLLHPMRHHAHMCLSTTSQSKGHPPSNTADRPTDSPRCRKRRKRKKKKRKCPPGGENNPELCHKRRTTSNHRKLQPNRLVKNCENEDSDECQRVVTVNKKKQKTNFSDNKLLGGPKKKKNGKKGAKKRHHVITSTEVATTTADDVTHDHDEDYGLDSTTHWDWEDSTAIPDMSMSISMSMPGAPTSAQPD